MRKHSTIADCLRNKSTNNNNYHQYSISGILVQVFMFIFTQRKSMKQILMFCFAIMLSIFLYAQEPVPAAKGVSYGAGAVQNGAIPVNELGNYMKDNKYSGKISGKVLEVCQEKGCWMKIENPGGETMMVKFKDYKFFMPKNIVGKEVVLDGEASEKEVSVKQLQHYAKDAGKSEEEIKKIKEPRKELQFVARGVLVL
jgi:Domain of unknown function (DUF4920)